MIQAVPVRLGKCELFSTPFPQIHSLDALDHHIAAEILEWFETAAPWELIETDFYEQFEFSFDDVDVPDHLGFLKDGAFELAVRQKISKKSSWWRISWFPNNASEFTMTAWKVGKRIDW